ncbi:hypothetical protein J4457_02715 [Candidatus Woesearchaeota archaeon]|nr:hypothetical protein [Candidatus Woesearchaeota archaeon]
MPNAADFMKKRLGKEIVAANERRRVTAAAYRLAASMPMTAREGRKLINEELKVIEIFNKIYRNYQKVYELLENLKFFPHFITDEKAVDAWRAEYLRMKTGAMFADIVPALIENQRRILLLKDDLQKKRRLLAAFGSLEEHMKVELKNVLRLEEIEENEINALVKELGTAFSEKEVQDIRAKLMFARGVLVGIIKEKLTSIVEYLQKMGDILGKLISSVQVYVTTIEKIKKAMSDKSYCEKIGKDAGLSNCDVTGANVQKLLNHFEGVYAKEIHFEIERWGVSALGFEEAETRKILQIFREIQEGFHGPAGQSYRGLPSVLRALQEASTIIERKITGLPKL